MSFTLAALKRKFLQSFPRIYYVLVLLYSMYVSTTIPICLVIIVGVILVLMLVVVMVEQVVVVVVLARDVLG